MLFIINSKLIIYSYIYIIIIMTYIDVNNLPTTYNFTVLCTYTNIYLNNYTDTPWEFYRMPGRYTEYRL